MEEARLGRPRQARATKSSNQNYANSFVDSESSRSTNLQYRQGGLITMQYLLLIYGSEEQLDKMSQAEKDKILKEYGDFTQSIAGSGHLRGGNELDRISKAKTVRVRAGKRTVTDGPFAETKEQLGGYYLVEAKSLDEALALAERIPSVRSGSIEVRPIIPHELLS